MEFAAFAALGPVIPRTMAAFGCTLQGAAVQDGGPWGGLPVRGDAQQYTPVLSHTFKDRGGNPALRLLIDHPPGRQVRRQIAPGRTRFDQLTQGIEDFAQVLFTGRRVFPHYGQIGCGQSPLLLAHSGGITRFRCQG